TPLPGNAGCLSHTPQPACTTAPKLDGAQTIVVAPDGRSAFTAGDPNVDAFRRDPSSGALSLAARIKGCPDSFFSRACDRGPKALIKSPHGLAVSPDSREIYVTSSSFAETGVVAVIRRR
ncbi:MAG TPA: hypothetical protein VHE14_06370, partial [Solirubrobacteraceae bacterium]|nr:hypothetical protein [Solirubrobacteraceae bacterium]